MFENVLTSEQLDLAERLLPDMTSYYLAGGTALALLLGHRRSIDFDLASSSPISPFDLERQLIKLEFDIQSVFTATNDEFSVLLNGVRVTFFNSGYALYSTE